MRGGVVKCCENCTLLGDWYFGQLVGCKILCARLDWQEYFRNFSFVDYRPQEHLHIDWLLLSMLIISTESTFATNKV